MSDKRILLVDDDTVILEILELALSREGYEIDKAPNGLEAIDKITKMRYDFIITDFAMPKADGLQVGLVAKKKDRTTVVFLMTGYGPAIFDEMVHRPEGEESFDRMLEKPFKYQEILNHIQEYGG